MRIPFVLEGTLAGRKEAGSFVRDGQTIAIPEKLQVLADAGDGRGVQLVEISGSAFDRMTPAFDHKSIDLGDRVKLTGEAVIQDRGSDRDSFAHFATCEVVAAKATPVRSAA